MIFGAVLLVLFLWRYSMGRIEFEDITSRQNEIFYWVTILISNTLGTALGDFVATTAGLGFEKGALVFSSLIACVAALRTALSAAMAQVERLLEASMVRIAVADPTTADARWCIGQYFAELNARFETGFNPEFSISADAAEFTPPAGVLLIARLRERPVGCGAVKIHRSGVTELERMWIAPVVRGFGLGRRMLKELERYAQAQGAKVIRLETNRVLKEAISLYRHSGYVEVTAFNDEPYADHWFEKRLAR